jgi:hypothetical protein
MFGEELLIISFEHQFPIRIGDFSSTVDGGENNLSLLVDSKSS